VRFGETVQALSRRSQGRRVLNARPKQQSGTAAKGTRAKKSARRKPEPASRGIGPEDVVAEPPRTIVNLGTMTQAANSFDPSKVHADQIAATSGPPETED